MPRNGTQEAKKHVAGLPKTGERVTIPGEGVVLFLGWLDKKFTRYMVADRHGNKIERWTY